MPQKPEIPVTLPDGRVVYFPAGTSPEEMTRQLIQAGVPLQAPTGNVVARPGGARPFPTEALQKALPYVGGAVGGMAGSLAGPPGAIGGAWTGGLAGGKLAGQPWGQAAETGLEQAGIEATGMGIQRLLAPWMKAAGIGITRRLLKPKNTLLKDMPNLAGKPLIEQGNKVAENVLQKGTIRPGTYEKFADEVRGLNTQVEAGIQGSKGTVDAEVPFAAGSAKAREFRRTGYPREANRGMTAVRERQTARNAMIQVGVDSEGNPVMAPNPAMPVQDAFAVRQMGDRVVEHPSQIPRGAGYDQASQAMQSEWRRGIAKAEPTVAPLLQRESEAITARDALNDALFRGGNRDPIQWAEHVGMLPLAGGGIKARTVGYGLGSLLNVPRVGSTVARWGLYKPGEAIANAPTGLRPQDLYRYLTMAMLGTGAGQEP